MLKVSEEVDLMKAGGEKTFYSMKVENSLLEKLNKFTNNKSSEKMKSKLHVLENSNAITFQLKSENQVVSNKEVIDKEKSKFLQEKLKSHFNPLI